METRSVNYASLALRYGLVITSTIVLFFAREDVALADLIIEIYFWINVVSIAILTLVLVIVAAVGLRDA